jgi:hypothetical protein
MKLILQLTVFMILSSFTFGQTTNSSVTWTDSNGETRRTTSTCHFDEKSADCTLTDTYPDRRVSEWVEPDTHPEFLTIGDFCKALHYGSKKTVACKAEWDVELDARARLAEHEQADKDAKARAAAFDAKYAIKAK